MMNMDESKDGFKTVGGNVAYDADIEPRRDANRFTRRVKSVMDIAREKSEYPVDAFMERLESD